jgi:hypothetical protein
MCSLWGCSRVCCLDSRGSFRGIFFMLDRRVVGKIEECVGEFLVVVSFRYVEYQFYWAFAGVYGSNANCDRRLLWDELSGENVRRRGLVEFTRLLPKFKP